MPQKLVYLFNTVASVFVIIDPFAMVPTYLAITHRYSDADTKKISRKATFIALVILLLFAYSGTTLFRYFGITMPAFQIAGGILLLLMGIEQLHGQNKKVKPEEESEGLRKEDVSVFPLATPLLAGPGAIATVVLQSSRAQSTNDLMVLSLAIAIAMFATLIVLRFATKLLRALGHTGLNLVTRLMGIMLTAIAVQYILNGIGESYNLLK